MIMCPFLYPILSLLYPHHIPVRQCVYLTTCENLTGFHYWRVRSLLIVAWKPTIPIIHVRVSPLMDYSYYICLSYTVLLSPVLGYIHGDCCSPMSIPFRSRMSRTPLKLRLLGEVFWVQCGLGHVLWLLVWNMAFIFPYIGNFIIPTH